jgi:TM2 domain-containing membrane protein YozV
MAVIGVVAIPGLHRFWVGQVGIGFLYLFTYGLLLFGTVTDIIKYKELAFAYNKKAAKGIVNNLVTSRSTPCSDGQVAFG